MALPYWHGMPVTITDKSTAPWPRACLGNHCQALRSPLVIVCPSAGTLRSRGLQGLQGLKKAQLEPLKSRVLRQDSGLWTNLQVANQAFCSSCPWLVSC